MILSAICPVILFSSAFAPSFESNDQIIAVRLFEAHRPIRSLKIFPPFEIVRSDFNSTVSSPMLVAVQQDKIVLTKIAADKTILAESRSFLLRKINSDPIALQIPSTARRRYHGDILLSLDKDRSLELINRVPLHDYIKDVVASESPSNACAEMLKAQAILCQTRFAQQKPSTMVGDSTQTQCYLGASLERPAINNAIDSVWGKILCYKGIPISVYYHSTCAGGTSDGANYFRLSPASVPYLCPVSCQYCHRSPFWTVTQTQIPSKLFAEVFGAGIPEILAQDYTGRPLSLKLGNGQIIDGYHFWIKLGQNFGWDKCPGTRFKIKQNINGNILVESTGAGHGIGLCQWGANELAKQGKNYKQILQYYFPGCQIR